MKEAKPKERHKTKKDCQGQALFIVILSNHVKDVTLSIVQKIFSLEIYFCPHPSTPGPYAKKALRNLSFDRKSILSN